MSWHLLDTDAVIDWLKGIAESITYIERLVNDGHVLATTDVVIAETWSGLLPKERAKGEELLSSFVFLPTSREAARRAGEWRYAYARRGITLSVADALIAATGYEHNAAIVTANVRDYPMPEINIVPLPRALRGTP